VVVEPGLAFGTGAHPTTRLCLELLLELLARLGGGTVLDVGCGSGVLAIAAARLGFAPVRALDVQAEAIEETQRNASASGVEVEAKVADALRDELPASDLALANVERATVEALAPRLSCRFLVASGYLERDAVVLPGFEHRARRVAEGWAADLYER
jgi:ribosomal protein L11 methyltransferase